MGPLIMLYHIELFEYTLSQFCSRFTLLLELEWPSSWDSKTGVLCEKKLPPTFAFGRVRFYVWGGGGGGHDWLIIIYNVPIIPQLPILK